MKEKKKNWTKTIIKVLIFCFIIIASINFVLIYNFINVMSKLV